VCLLLADYLECESLKPAFSTTEMKLQKCYSLHLAAILFGELSSTDVLIITEQQNGARDLDGM